MNNDDFDQVKTELLFKKNDPQDRRLGEMLSDKDPDCLIWGYPDDEGVELSKGRLGAKEGPDAIRSVLYKMTPRSDKKILKFNDLGNLKSKEPLLNRHERACQLAVDSLKNKKRVVTLGGGHDYGFADFSALCIYAESIKKTPFIINFDAHLDVREDSKGPSSGTPFFRLLNKHKKVDFFEVGIQNWCHSKKHFEWLKSKKAKVFTYDEIINSSLNFTKFLYRNVFKSFDKKKHVLGLSIDIDAFSSDICPGASQVFPLGLNSQDFYLCFLKILSDFKPPMVGIYEVNPLFDQDQRTAKFAAILVHTFLHS